MTRPRLVLALAAVLCLAVLLSAEQASAAKEPVTVTVVPFSSSDVGQHAWLGKSIADILTRKLAQVPRVTVLERERVQAFLDELNLQETGFFTQDDAGRMGRVARVDQVIYGNFSLRGKRLEINLILVDLATQNALQRGRVSGPLDRLHELVARLSLDLLAGRGVILTAEDRDAIQFAPTNSLPATRYFYQGLDHADHGRYEDAFGAFYAATRQDPGYREAQLWMGKVLELLGSRNLAIVAFDELAQQPGRRVERYDALMFMARLLEDSDMARAVSIYRGLVETRPAVPHSLEAAYRLAGLLEQQKDYAGAYQAFAFIDGFRDRVEKNPTGFSAQQRDRAVPSLSRVTDYLRARLDGGQGQRTGTGVQPFYVTESGIRQSRFFNWRHALGLYREAVVRMAILYPKLPPRPKTGARPAPPRGVFVVDPENPVITQRRFRSTPSLFHEERYTKNWLEAFYTVVIPEGYVATGAELTVTGRSLVRSMRTSFAMRLMPFPLPRNYGNAWLGTIYGQTREYRTLQKPIHFFGRHRRFLALQFIENHSEISGWELRVHLKPADGVEGPAAPPANMAEGFWEGQSLGRVVTDEAGPGGATLPIFRKMRHPKKSLALADNHDDGLYLISAHGEIGGRPTDLWLSHREPGGTWSPPSAMAVNAAGEDYAPQLVRAEHGGLRLFWLSDRRGRGWELWTSELPLRNGRKWTAPTRVPLEDFVATGFEEPASRQEDLLLYSVAQDRRGRWILAYYSVSAKQVVFLVSSNGADWKLAAAQAVPRSPANVMLAEDGKGVYRLGAVTQRGDMLLWRSNDLVRWTKKTVRAGVLGTGRGAKIYPGHLFAEPNGELLLLLSDRTFGVQYARFDPDTRNPVLDLVKDAGLETFTATASDQGTYLIALQGSDGVTLRRYRKFQSPAVPQNPRGSRLYTEVETDGSGNTWRRTIARARFILPDVTAVGVQPGGRIWWAVETGIFSMDGQDSFFQDVSQGFFNHYVSDIVPCGRGVYFSSRYLDEPRVGVALARKSSGRTYYKVEARRLSGAVGRVTAISCDSNQRLIAGTSHGDVVVLAGAEIVRRFRLGHGQAATVIAAHPRRSETYVGTDKGRLYRITDDLRQIDPSPAQGRAIQGVAIDRSDRLWLAIEGTGLFVRRDGRWLDRSPAASDVPYFSVAALRADPVGGIWLLPNPEIEAAGLGYINGGRVRFFNPPHRRLRAPVDFDVASDGAVWIGTAFDGLYKLERLGQ